jgi:DNA primase
MAKISPIASKYIIRTSIKIDGIVDRPDVIGAVFGQTEGLLGNDLELRELQRSGKIGRIEVNLKTQGGKTSGEIVIPSSLDKTETAIVAAALEIIQRIGPCNANIKVQAIEDVRISKRNFVIDRAKALLADLTENTLPDSTEIASEVAESVRMMEIKSYGHEKLPAGPEIKDSEEIIIVEGRADVLIMLKHGFKNVIAMQGSSVPKTIIELSKTKSTTIFADGDRGGDLNIRELISVAEIDFVCKAPDGKEVEELTKKEIHKALRGRITAEQAKLDLGVTESGELIDKDRRLSRPLVKRDSRNSSSRDQKRNDRKSNNRDRDRNSKKNDRRTTTTRTTTSPTTSKSTGPSDSEKTKFKDVIEDLVGTRGACIFNDKLNILGKVPMTELTTTIKSLGGGIHAIVLDGDVDDELAKTAESLKINLLIGTKNSTKNAKIKILTDKDL